MQLSPVPTRRRIGLYAGFLEPGRTGGAETYVRCLVRELQHQDVNEDFLIFAAQDHGFEITNDRFTIVECNVDASRRKRRILWEQISLSRLLKQHRLDLVHFPYGTMPCFYRGRAVVTVHDTLRFCFPDTMPRGQIAYRTLIESRMAAAGHHVICVSHADAAVLAGHMNIPSSRIHVVYHGVSDEFLAGGDTSFTEEQRCEVLWVGRPYPRKNVETLLRAYGILRRQQAELPLLRLVGVEAEHRARLRAVLQAEGLNALVSLEPPIPHEALKDRFRKAILFVYPSKYESFGLPVLEAMAAGVPAVCADIPAFRELYLDAVIYAVPDSPADFATAIKRLLDDPASRRQLAVRGRDRAAQFTWQACAQDTYALYRTLIDGAATDCRSARLTSRPNVA